MSWSFFQGLKIHFFWRAPILHLFTLKLPKSYPGPVRQRAVHEGGDAQLQDGRDGEGGYQWLPHRPQRQGPRHHLHPHPPEHQHPKPQASLSIHRHSRQVRNLMISRTEDNKNSVPEIPKLDSRKKTETS